MQVPYDIRTVIVCVCFLCFTVQLIRAIWPCYEIWLLDIILRLQLKPLTLRQAIENRVRGGKSLSLAEHRVTPYELRIHLE